MPRCSLDTKKVRIERVIEETLWTHEASEMAKREAAFWLNFWSKPCKSRLKCYAVGWRFILRHRALVTVFLRQCTVSLLIHSIPAPSYAGNLHRHILSLNHCGFVNPKCLYNSGMVGSVLDISSLHLSRHLFFGAIFPKMIAQRHKAAAVL